MKQSSYTPSGHAASALIPELLRVNGRLLTAGDALLAEIGITSARSQVLAEIARNPAPEPVSRLARQIGLSRQNVQRIVNELEIDGLIRLEENPHHKRAKLVILTPKGAKVHTEADKRQIPWINVLTLGLTPEEIGSALRVLRTLRTRLETADED